LIFSVWVVLAGEAPFGVFGKAESQDVLEVGACDVAFDEGGAKGEEDAGKAEAEGKAKEDEAKAEDDEAKVEDEGGDSDEGFAKEGNDDFAPTGSES
jgi:hypothetical protein